MIYVLLPFILTVIVLFIFKILIKTKKIEVESKDANTIKQPTAYLWAGILTVTIGLAINSERDFRKTQQKTPNNIENSLQMIA